MFTKTGPGCRKKWKGNSRVEKWSYEIWNRIDVSHHLKLYPIVTLPLVSQLRNILLETVWTKNLEEIKRREEYMHN